MSSSLNPMITVPLDTYQAARRIYNLAHVYLVIGDRLDSILTDSELPKLDSSSDLGISNALILALITAFQYAESLPDNQAEEAARKRMDWKYALHLPLSHPGFSADVFCRFRQNLSASSEALVAFHRVLCFLAEAGLYPLADIQTIDPTAVITRVCQLSRFAQLNQAMKTELSHLVGHTPDWLRVKAPPHWYFRYANGHTKSLLSQEPEELVASAERLGADLDRLLNLLKKENPPIADIQPRICNLSQLLEKQFVRYGDGLKWRLPGCLNCTLARRDEHHG